MSNKPQFSLVGRAEDDEAHGCYNDHVDPSSTRDFVGNPAFPHYLLTNDSGWTPTLSDEVYEDLYQAQELQNTEQQLYYPEEGDLFADVETYMETKRNFSESLQVVTDEVLTDDILRNTLEPQQFVAAFRQESPQQCVRSNSDHLSQRGRTRQIETVPYINGMHHIIPNASSPLEVEANRPTQYEVGSETLFRGSFNQSEGALLSHDVPILRPSSKSQPCHPLHGELNDKVFDPIQKRNNGERRRVGIKQLCDTLLTHRQCEEPVQQRTSGLQPISCHKSDGPSKTLCHQRSTASRAICEIIKGNIKPTIDPVTGCYVVQLHDLRGPRRAANESTRCVEKQTIGDGRKMANSARIERAPQLVTNSIPATSSSLRRNLPFNSGVIREPLLTNEPATEAMRRPDVLTGNAVNTTTRSLSRFDHSYHRRQSSSSDQDNYLKIFQETSKFRVTSTKRLGVGTLLTREPSHGNLTSHLGRITTETISGAEVHRTRSPNAGSVWNVQSVFGNAESS